MGRKRTVCIILVALLAVCAVWWVVRERDDDYKKFFEEHSRIAIPLGTSNVVHFTEFEFACSSHYTIPPGAREGFARQNGFQPEPPEAWEPIFHIEDLTPPWNQLPAGGEVFYATGADAATAWDAVYHPKSGSLWTAIYYADYSGDLPARVIAPPR